MDTEVAVSQVDYRSVHRDWSDRQSGETRGTLHQRSSSRLFFFFPLRKAIVGSSGIWRERPFPAWTLSAQHQFPS